MQITKTPADGAFLLTVAGRLDGYWADHLDNALSEAVRDGHHHLRVDLSQVTFLSSAGIAALMKFYKQLSRITGTFVVVNPSSSVRLVLEMTRLSAVLIAPDIRSAVTVAMPRPGRAVARAGVAFEVFDPPMAPTCLTICSQLVRCPTMSACCTAWRVRESSRNLCTSSRSSPVLPSA